MALQRKKTGQKNMLEKGRVIKKSAAKSSITDDFAALFSCAPKR